MGEDTSLGVSLEEGQVVFRDVIGDLPAVGGPAVFEQVGDAVDEHRGLAAACTGQKEQRAFGGEDALLLAGVQVGELPGDDLTAEVGKQVLILLGKHRFTVSFCNV